MTVGSSVVNLTTSMTITTLFCGWRKLCPNLKRKLHSRRFLERIFWIICHILPSSKVINDMTKTVDRKSFAYLFCIPGNVKEALKLTYDLLDLNPYHQRATGNRFYFENVLRNEKDYNKTDLDKLVNHTTSIFFPSKFLPSMSEIFQSSLTISIIIYPSNLMNKIQYHFQIFHGQPETDEARKCILLENLDGIREALPVRQHRDPTSFLHQIIGFQRL